MLTLEDVKSMTTPQLKKGGDKRAWSIAVESTWVRFYTATNVKGFTHIPSDVLGAPTRLARDKDGSIKFSKAGRPVTRVHPVLAEQVRVARQNYEADLLDFAGSIASEMPDAYKAEVESAQPAAQPVLEGMVTEVETFLAELAAQQAALETPTPSEDGISPKRRKAAAPA